MHRLVLVFLAACLLIVLPSRSGGSSEPPVATAESRDCCPDSGDEDDADCCDYDFGLCCTSLAAGLPHVDFGSRAARSTSAELPLQRRLTLLTPRAIGPPPTPPPIA